jgi:hypothetical protein
VGLSHGTEVCNDIGPMHCAGSLVDVLSSQPCLEVYAAEQSQFFVAVQVKSAMRLLRWDKMVRARQQRRYKHFSTQGTRALLRVSSSTRPHMTGDTPATHTTRTAFMHYAHASCAALVLSGGLSLAICAAPYSSIIPRLHCALLHVWCRLVARLAWAPTLLWRC